MIRSGILALCGFWVASWTTILADEPCLTEAAPERGRMDVPFSRIFHYNRPVLRRVGAWFFYHPAPAPPSAKFVLIRPCPVAQPQLYRYFPSPDMGYGCGGCNEIIMEPPPTVYLDAPIEE